MGYFLGGLDQGSGAFGAEIKHGHCRLPRDHQSMTFTHGHDVHEGECLVVLIDLVGRRFAAEDLGEDIVVVIGGDLHGSFLGRQSLSLSVFLNGA